MSAHTYTENVERASPVPPQLLSAQSLARRLEISVRTLWRLRSAGKLPKPVKLGGNVRWRTNDIDEWISAGCPDQGCDADSDFQ